MIIRDDLNPEDGSRAIDVLHELRNQLEADGAEIEDSYSNEWAEGRDPLSVWREAE